MLLDPRHDVIRPVLDVAGVGAIQGDAAVIAEINHPDNLDFIDYADYLSMEVIQLGLVSPEVLAILRERWREMDFNSRCGGALLSPRSTPNYPRNLYHPDPDPRPQTLWRPMDI